MVGRWEGGDDVEFFLLHLVGLWFSAGFFGVLLFEGRLWLDWPGFSWCGGMGCLGGCGGR